MLLDRGARGARAGAPVRTPGWVPRVAPVHCSAEMLRRLWAPLAILVATCAGAASPHETMHRVGVYGLGVKSGAAVPSVVIAGAGAVVTVHGLNFSPGGGHSNAVLGLNGTTVAHFLCAAAPLAHALSHTLTRSPALSHYRAHTHSLSTPASPLRRGNGPPNGSTHFPTSTLIQMLKTADSSLHVAGVNCEYCNLRGEQSLCRFDDSDPFPFTFTDTTTVNCRVSPKASTIGFAGLSFSNNGGSDWTELSAFSEHAIVNFIAEPSTSTIIAPAAPAGMPIVLKGRNFGRDHASFGCSFDGAPAGAMGAGDGGGGRAW